jgi:GNAT superfamily N-acetyltransferase
MGALLYYQHMNEMWVGAGSRQRSEVGVVQLRDAVSADFAQFGAFFRAIVAEGESYNYPEDLSDEEIERLWLLPGWSTMAALGDDGSVLGMAKFGPNHPNRGAHIANASFMVNPAAQGQGIGRVLGEQVLLRAREAGYQGMQFNAVVETNTAAVKLWQSLGFQIMTTIPGAFRSRRHGFVGLHIMFRSLVD